VEIAAVGVFDDDAIRTRRQTDAEQSYDVRMSREVAEYERRPEELTLHVGIVLIEDFHSDARRRRDSVRRK
jgi:hypothetical protein